MPQRDQDTDFRQLAESLPQLVWAAHPDGTVYYFNARIESYAGVESDESGQWHWDEMVHEEDRAFALKVWRNAIAARRPCEATYRLNLRDGGWRWHVSRAEPARDKNGDVVRWFGTATDIHDLRVTEEALRKSERRASNILERSSDGFIALDHQWRITFLNPAAKAMLEGLVDSPAELIGRPFWEAIPQVPGSPFGEAYRKAAREQVSVDVEAFYPPLNSWFDVRCYPTGDGLAIHFLDVGLRKRAEDALRQNEARFRAMADDLPLIIWLHDPAGKLDFVNQTYCDLFGVTREEVLTDRWQLLVHPDDASAYVEEFLACVRDQRPFHKQARVRRSDQEWRWMESWGRPRFGDRREYLGHVGTSVDITDRKRYAERLSWMVSELNHRVQNALAGVQSVIGLSGEGASSVTEFKAALLGRIQALAAGHSLIARADWQYADIEQLARSVLEPFGSDRLRVSGPRTRASGEAALPIAMILHELATNSAKHGAWSATGTVTLGWQSAQSDEGHLELTWTERGGPEVKEPETSGFGLEFIRMTAAYELDGTCRFAFEPEGFTCILELPSARVLVSSEPTSPHVSRG